MFRIALRNIWRNKRRTILTGSTIAIAVMVVIYIWSLVNGIVQNMFDGTVRSTSGHIRILNKEYIRREAMLPLEANIADVKGLTDITSANPAVTFIASRIKFGVLLNIENDNKPTLGIGVDPEKEERISELSRYIVEGRKIVAGSAEVNVGFRLARDMRLKVGDTMTILTQTAYGSLGAINLKIVGIFRSGVFTLDNKVFYLPLDQAQKLLDLDNRATELFLLIKNPDEAIRVAGQLQAVVDQTYPGKYRVRPWQDQGIIWIYMRVAKYAYGFIYLLILTLASFTILNTMFMAVLERTREIGMMKAVGMKDNEVVRLIILEAVMIGILASAIGAIGGSGMSYYLSVYGINFTEVFEKMGSNFDFPLGSIYRAEFSWLYVFTGFAFGVLFAALAAIPPALRAAKMEPVEALRE